MNPTSEGGTTSAVEVVDSILATGQARMTLDVDDAALLAAVVGDASAFFARPADAKRLHSGADANFGYRPMGIEYSVTPDRPDVNESFTVWSDRTDLIENHQHVGALLEHTVAWQTRLAEIVAAILDRFVEVLGGHSAESIRFARASHVQINSSLGAPPERELLQDCHEDGHLVTVLHANDVGLEAGSERQLSPVSLRPNEIFVMPGSILTLVSGGRVEPLFHQVRNAGIVGRISVMYFVNPQLDRPVHPWAEHDALTTDLRPTIRENPTEFGLPTVPDV